MSTMEQDGIPFFCSTCLSKRTGEDEEAPLTEITNSLNAQKSPEPQAGTSTGASTGPPTDEHDKETSDDDDEEVQNVTNMRSKGGKTQYLIVWKKGGSKSWIDAEKCKGCVAKINVFRASKKLEALPVPVGASSDGDRKYNEDNWISIENIMKNISIFDRSSKNYHKKIDIKAFEESLGSEDKIYIVVVWSHCYSILYLAKENRIYLADGGNRYLKDPQAAKGFRRRIGKPVQITAIPFYQQRTIDECGSSASLLAIEFKKIYQTMSIPTEMRVPKWDQSVISKKEHKFPSATLAEFKFIHEINTDRCNKCGKIFRGRNRSPFVTHQRFCG